MNRAILLVAFVCLNASAQTTKHQQSELLLGIITDATNRPSLVRDDTGDWHPPVRVYHDSKIEVFIPNLGDDHWVAWHIDAFKSFGSYFTYMYTYGVHSHEVHRMLIIVQTKEGVAKLSTPMEVLAYGPIIKLPLAYKTAIEHTTSMLRRNFDRYQGESLQDAANNSRALSSTNLEVLRERERITTAPTNKP